MGRIAGTEPSSTEGVLTGTSASAVVGVCSLAHVIISQMIAAYRRRDQLERRQLMMDGWCVLFKRTYA